MLPVFFSAQLTGMYLVFKHIGVPSFYIYCISENTFVLTFYIKDIFMRIKYLDQLSILIPLFQALNSRNLGRVCDHFSFLPGSLYDFKNSLSSCIKISHLRTGGDVMGAEMESQWMMFYAGQGQWCLDWNWGWRSASHPHNQCCLLPCWEVSSRRFGEGPHRWSTNLTSPLASPDWGLSHPDLRKVLRHDRFLSLLLICSGTTWGHGCGSLCCCCSAVLWSVCPFYIKGRSHPRGWPEWPFVKTVTMPLAPYRKRLLPYLGPLRPELWLSGRPWRV